MQRNLVDWYKMIDIAPADEALFEKRRQAIEEIKKMVLDSSNWDFLASCIVGAASGFDILGKDSEFTQAIIKCYQTHIVSFPSNLADNALELRVAAGLVIEEIFSCAPAQEGDTKNDTEVAAPLFLSTLGLIPAPLEAHLADRMLQLKSTAENLLETDARELRARNDLNLSSFESFPLPPDQANWTKFITQIQSAFNQLEQQVAADKEELEILWWLQNRFSKRLNESFSNMPAFKAALYVGLELAETILLPPLNSMVAIVQKAVENDRNASDIKPKPLKLIFSRKKTDTWALLAPADKSTNEFVASFPSLFPLSWLGMRLQESKGSAAWEEEFSKRTGVLVDQPFTPVKIANQVFREQIALRIYKDHLRD
jgi:hypothetical protein